ncbi:MAG: hypothetical protein NVSMB26_04710 [Beijerinckiaceae bacterium]
MHNDLAWAVLGVDPAIHRVVEDSARQQGVSIGRCLELMLAASRANAAARATETLALQKRQQLLRDVVSDMAESLIKAADLLRSETARAEEPNDKSDSPQDETALTVEKIQTRMRTMDDKTIPSNQEPKVSEFRRSFLRRSA